MEIFEQTHSQSRVTLVLFSGGIDSTHLLFDLLKNTGDIVLAHHVHMINREARREAEAQACELIVEYCQREFRNFFYTESAVDRSKFKAPGIDVFTAAFEGGIAASNFLLDTGTMPHRWTLGINQEEMDDLSANQGDRRPILRSIMTASTWPNTPPEYYRPELKPKARLIEEMGSELTKLCWTCRRPVLNAEGGYNECGECRTCLLMNEIRVQY